MRPDPEIVKWQTELDSAFEYRETIDIWKIPLLKSETQAIILSDDELTRLANMQSGLTRSVFYSSRVYMKHLLMCYTGLATRELLFSKNRFGKPYIKNSNLEFNLSHTGELILLAISRTHSLGIDVEKTRVVKNWESIANKVFSQELIDALHANSNPEASFIDFWIQFEATQKMHGSGVFGSKADLVSIQLLCFMPEQGYQGCLAINSSERPEIRFFDAGALELTNS